MELKELEAALEAVSNYECMYASEVAIYKAFAEALKQSGFLTLPASERM